MNKAFLSFFILFNFCVLAQSDTVVVLDLIHQANQLYGSDYNKSIQLAEMAKEQSIKIHFKRGEALAYNELALIYQNKGELPQAEKLVRTAIKELTEWGTIKELAGAINTYGLIAMGQSNYREAEGYYSRAFNMFSSLNDTAGIIKTTHNLGVVNYYQSHFEKTAQYYNQSLRLAEKINNQKYININLLNLGLYYDTQSDFNKSTFYLKKALANYQSANNKVAEANCWQGLGTNYYNAGLLDSSLLSHQNALAIFEKMTNTNGIANELCNLADIYVQQKQYNKADVYYKKSIQIRKSMEDKFGLMISYVGLADSYHAQGNNNLARQYYDSTLAISTQINSPWRIAEVYLNISNFEASIGNYKQAYEAIHNYVITKDTLFTAEKTKLAAELEAQYENEKQQQEIVTKQNEIHYLQKSNRLIIWLWVLSALSALLIIALLIVRSKKVKEQALQQIEIEKKDRQLAQAKQKEAELELEYKKKELTQLALHISNQNEFLETFKNNLKDATDEKQLKNLRRELESKLALDKDREAFEMNIDLIHEAFFRKLNEKFPILTENDKKLCAMLRLNLSSKEIASVQNIEVKSVDMNRYRLRKKLNLSVEDDLILFLSTI